MNPKELGRKGEDLAAHFLEARGWTVLGRNVREGRQEVDLVVFRAGVLAFVEVKARGGKAFGHPLEAITVSKRGEIAKVARAWLRRHPPPLGTEVRFDAVSVVITGEGAPELLHLPDAWRLG